VDTGDAANLSVFVKGAGNLPVINAPAISWPANMESYEVSNKENIDKTVAPLGGTKTYSYSFICTKPGKYILPPVKMSYFDPATKVYKTIESDPLSLTVRPSKETGKRRGTPFKRIRRTGQDTYCGDQHSFCWAKFFHNQGIKKMPC
jgi:hypothetical protein